MTTNRLEKRLTIFGGFFFVLSIFSCAGDKENNRKGSVSSNKVTENRDSFSIVGGEAISSEYSFSTSLSLLRQNKSLSFGGISTSINRRCTAVKLSNKALLTAKHCLQFYKSTGEVKLSPAEGLGLSKSSGISVTVPKKGVIANSASKMDIKGWRDLSKISTASAVAELVDLAVVYTSTNVKGKAAALCNFELSKNDNVFVTGMTKTPSGFEQRMYQARVKDITSNNVWKMARIYTTEATDNQSCGEAGDSGGGLFAYDTQRNRYCLAAINIAKGLANQNGCSEIAHVSVFRTNPDVNIYSNLTRLKKKHSFPSAAQNDYLFFE